MTILKFGHRRFALAALAAFSIFAVAPAHATKIERVKSPGGIEAWLVRDSSVPLVSIDFAFRGGANQDPASKPGVANFASDMLDEGAGDLDSRTFQQRLEQSAVELRYRAQHDFLYGSVRTLRDRKDEAFELLRLSLTSPRFDAEPMERVRAQTLTSLGRETTNPNDIASKLWWNTAFPDHPYGRPVNGTLESYPLISADDLRAYTKRVMTRDNLVVGVVGDIDAATLGKDLDRIFGGLPAKGELRPTASAKIEGLGRTVLVNLDVPQTVLSFGGTGIARKDPDFMAAFIINHILGGGSFSSRLYREVREKRGLAYSVYSYLLPLDYTALTIGNTATRADRAQETLTLIQAEIARMSKDGPDADELAKAKSYLKGSYALNFDTSSKIANQLVQLQLSDLGIDYIDRRDGLIDAVTIDDVKRVAKRLFDGGVLVTMVGRMPDGTAKDGGVKKEGG